MISDPKPRPNHRRYIEVLRRLTPQQRLEKAIELTEASRYLFRVGLRERNPGLSDEELQELYLKQTVKWHNRNY
jgi:hypothetical protein